MPEPHVYRFNVTFLVVSRHRNLDTAWPWFRRLLRRVGLSPNAWNVEDLTAKASFDSKSARTVAEIRERLRASRTAGSTP